MTQTQAYYNGEWIPDEGLAIPVNDPGFTLGITVVERLRTFAGRVWRQHEHVARLRISADIVGLPAGVVDDLDQAITEYMLRHEPLRAAASRPDAVDDWAIVAFATPGADGIPTRVVHGFPLPFATWAAQYESGVSLRTSDHRQVPNDCWPSELKCRSRMHYYLADRQAQLLEPGARAVLLDQEGFVGEASTANLLIYRADEGIVSPKTEKILPGVSILVIRELAERLGVPYTERDIGIDELRTAEEAWLASTSICMLPVTKCDGQPVGSGKPGNTYKRFLDAWNSAVGLDIASQAKLRSTPSGQS